VAIRISFQPSARRASVIARPPLNPRRTPTIAAGPGVLGWHGLAQHFATRRLIAEGLVFPLKAGNKPDRNGG
jgi:hypothetical protein